ncbi:uncharacterized protein LOC126846454 [Adelges cooleyi]|uniref:uncharacterized protein LOC126846454 n=1 Tax=Adelges cooleyi TaxID=133065 RepID=UPI00218016BE|nr:uncharacterized protein LOC126846454 [Adelges cooleyi]
MAQTIHRRTYNLDKSKQAQDDVKLMEIEANYADQTMQAATMEVMVASSRLQTAQEDVSYAASMLHSSRLQFIENDKMLMDARKKADVLSAMMRSVKTDSVARKIMDDNFEGASTEISRN